MELFLLRVEDRFQLTGRGCILVPYIESDTLGDIKPNFMAQVICKRPDGSQIRSTAWIGYEFLHPTGGGIACLLKDRTVEEIPTGTEVWLITETVRYE